MSKHLLRLVLLVAIAVTAFTAYAGITFRGSSATVGSISGYYDYSGAGKKDTVKFTADVTVTVTDSKCWNPAGNWAPGQKTFTFTVPTQTFTEKADKNGRVTGSYKVEWEASAKDAGCPNGKWDVEILAGTAYATLSATNTATGDSDSVNYVCDLVSGVCTEQ